MILDGNHKMLLSLCLQQTLIHPVRKFIKANESIARLKLCVKFLRDCERAGVFPNSIMSMKAPQMKSSDTIMSILILASNSQTFFAAKH